MRDGIENIRWAIVDVEVSLSDQRIHDLGVLRYDGAVYHGCSKESFEAIIQNTDYICGHNIIHHDAKFLFTDGKCNTPLVDTLYLSPLLFPERPYHRLVKDDKLISEQLNNPVNDCEKARDLMMDEIACWQSLQDRKRRILTTLLYGKKEFQGFLSMVGAAPIHVNLSALIWNEYMGRICQYADITAIIEQYPVELAYALALIDTNDERSVTPGWVLHNYPGVEYVMGVLRQRHCQEPDCEFCNSFLDTRSNLKTFFGYDEFRTYGGEPLQERAAKAAVDGRSLLAIFPTGGGK